jgi:DNA-binding FrmR family transcriptional regulator
LPKASNAPTGLEAALDLIPPGGIMDLVIPEIKSRAIHRAKILQGQLKGLEKMIESEEYCMDVITQSLAIQKSLGSLNKLLVENHLATHVKDMMASKDPKVQAQVQQELLRIFEITENRQTK